jgi:hypothetical protein
MVSCEFAMFDREQKTLATYFEGAAYVELHDSA